MALAASAGYGPAVSFDEREVDETVPRYQFYFDTQHRDEPYGVHVEDDEVLATVLPDILTDLKEDGLVLEGEGKDMQVVAAGRILDLDAPLPTQGVRPNDVLRVSLIPLNG